MAREEQQHKVILRSTNGIMFMGTPHDGADIARLANSIARIAKTVTRVNTNNLRISSEIQCRSRTYLDHSDSFTT